MGIFGNDDTVRRRKLAEPSFAASWSGVKRRLSIIHGDALEVLPTLSNIDAVVCDPPYHLQSIVKRFGGVNAAPAKFGTDGAFARSSRGFMGKQWDGGDIAFRPETWRLVFNALKPGAHILVFGGTRTYHRMACAIEDAGFEVRDAIMWTYGSGFPKSHDVERAIAVQLCTLPGRHFATTLPREDKRRPDDHICPECAEGLFWDGWGSAVKPAVELICVARKPLIGTLAQNVLQHGTGGLNIDACRVPAEPGDNPMQWDSPRGGIWSTDSNATGRLRENTAGRWPANLCHDGSDEVLALFPDTGVSSGGRIGNAGGGNVLNIPTGNYRPGDPGFGDSGSAARFFYTAKADADDRAWSSHPTVKPLDLMRWLVRLVTPPGGTVLDPFAGSGTTLEAAILENFNAIGIEREAEYIADIKRRLDPWSHMYHTGRRKLCD